MITHDARRILAGLATMALSACAGSLQPSAQPSAAASATLSDADRGAGWRSLFDGRSLGDWRGYKSQQVPTGWTIVDGTIVKPAGAEDLVTREQYGNFEFSLDWKLAEGGNAGIFYRATEEYDHIYWSGPEYQLLDDERAADGKNRLTSAASAYGLYAPPAGVVHAAGQWNSTRILVRGNHVEHWLNGEKVVEYEFGSADWEAKVKKSKFGAWPNYGRAARGYIGIQGDHNGMLALRNLKIRVLP
ncbi:MAG: DUF1080 domain-containing protein [bacterium]